MATVKKKIEKRWRITFWHFDLKTQELEMTDVRVTKPITEKRAHELIRERLTSKMCWKLERYYR